MVLDWYRLTGLWCMRSLHCRVLCAEGDLPAPTSTSLAETHARSAAAASSGFLEVGRFRLPLAPLPAAGSLSDDTPGTALGAVAPAVRRPYALTRSCLLALERIAGCIEGAEPLLLVGETGTGKASAMRHLAEALRQVSGHTPADARGWACCSLLSLA